ncbi:MAG: sgaU [Paenibacillus sp.]|nr:sgaU [Paenibacillus sp.]
MKIGVLNTLTNDGDCFDKVRDFGLDVCQLVSWDHNQATESIADNVLRYSRAAGVQISAVWAGLPPPQIWDFKEGPGTLGIVPTAYRAERVNILRRFADFASRIGAPAVITHCGFIPENMSDPEYPAVVDTIREVAAYCSQLGIEFWLETGQETPVVLLRTIERVGMANVGINLDPANLIMYGKGNPVDALDLIGPYVRDVHVKDGLYPTNGDHLGFEVQVGQGKVNFPVFLARLKEIGFRGELIIEREIGGEEQTRDIRATIGLLENWLKAPGNNGFIHEQKEENK